MCDILKFSDEKRMFVCVCVCKALKHKLENDLQEYMYTLSR